MSVSREIYHECFTEQIIFQFQTYIITIELTLKQTMIQYEI